MSELEEKLGTILSNPQLMQQISAMAQALGQAPPEPSAPMPTTAQSPARGAPVSSPARSRHAAKGFRNAAGRSCGSGAAGAASRAVAFSEPIPHRKAGTGHAGRKNGGIRVGSAEIRRIEHLWREVGYV